MSTLSTSSTSAPPISIPTETFLSDDPIASRISYLTSTTTTLIACIVPIIAIMYILLLSWTYQYSQRNPRPLNKTSGLRLQKYAPGVYVFLVLTSLSEVALASWLVLQYRFNHNYPTVQFRTGTRLILFTSVWTSITGGAYTLLFLHPSWSKHPVSSVGAQAIWVFTTWLFWVVGVSIVNPSVANLLDKGSCEIVAYCSQIRGLYGVALVEIFTLTIGMAIMIWLAWESARYSVGPAIYPMN
ncbi:hypothetical protein HYPSUDRAFT_301973 [Hypholoma sublateritium FD-334 SS-4]|uniref:MARVEL domain-containing protein n=1 Tax=Hypholoma sublateritium (strain FD-334 SS-4) TaxID=945553 RepID=A0A0D2LZ68_HYPSF|nr:hypothetical protein HYPSUDRAFT_301973 [Hypholoma sublateritium FD-334 SS-4]